MSGDYRFLPNQLAWVRIEKEQKRAEAVKLFGRKYLGGTAVSDQVKKPDEVYV